MCTGFYLLFKDRVWNCLGDELYLTDQIQRVKQPPTNPYSCYCGPLIAMAKRGIDLPILKHKTSQTCLPYVLDQQILKPLTFRYHHCITGLKPIDAIFSN